MPKYDVKDFEKTNVKEVTVLIKQIAYKDPIEWSKEDKRYYNKYWCKLERENPLLCLFLYNLNNLLFQFQYLIPELYGKYFKKKQVWDKDFKGWKWIDIETTKGKV